MDEDYAGNGLHLLLVLVALGALVLRRSTLPRSLPQYALCVAGGFLLFCMLLKWQPWGTRLQMPLFVIASPLTALALPLANRKGAVTALAAVMLLCSLPWLFRNESRPLWGDRSILNADSESLYFAKRPRLQPYYVWGADFNSQRQPCNTIGLESSNNNAYEYPLWVLLGKRQGEMPRIEHINVSNVSGRIPIKNFNPCAAFEIR